MKGNYDAITLPDLLEHEIGLSKSYFWQKWLKTQIGEGIV
jgi:hypothetical protein